MARHVHNQDGLWIQPFKYINNDPNASRYYLDEYSYVVYPIKLSKRDGKVIVSYPYNTKGNITEVRYGQFISPLRNIKLIKKIYFNYDISLNGLKDLKSDAKTANEMPRILLDNKFLNESLNSYNLPLLNYDTYIHYPQNFYKLYIGFNKQRLKEFEIGPLKNLEALFGSTLAGLPDDCFQWLEVKNEQIDFTGVEDLESLLTSSDLIIDYKIVFDLDIITQWAINTFPISKFNSLSNIFNNEELELSLLLYPPIISSMQLVDQVKFISPVSYLKNRMVDKVIFSVPASYADKSQKFFEIQFIDCSSNAIIFNDNSMRAGSQFYINNLSTNPTDIDINLDNSVFENISNISYPTEKFIMVYKIPEGIQKFLSENLNYKIVLRVTDLTSERFNGS